MAEPKTTLEELLKNGPRMDHFQLNNFNARTQEDRQLDRFQLLPEKKNLRKVYDGSTLRLMAVSLA